MSWQEQIETIYKEREKSVFILYGNTDDLFEANDKSDYELNEFMSQVTFTKRDIVLNFNVGTGLKFRDQKSKSEFQKLLYGYDSLKGTNYTDKLPSDIGEIFRLFDRYIKINGNKKSISLIIDHAELLIPNEELNSLDLSNKKIIITLLEWAKSQEIKDKDITIVLLTDNLFQLHNEIVGSPDIAKIEIEFPNEEERKKTVKKYINQYNVQSELSQTAISKIINGLNRKAIKELFLTFRDGKLQYEYLAELKKELIEKDNFRFIEFIESERTLNDFAGSEKVKIRLREDAELIKNGKHDAIPMGYLICGPIGTGKTYLGECFAGEVGIPVVKLKNFREKWVGASEGNWEKILKTLENLAPVIVMIDEADASLGNREQEGDSGTSKRIFSSLAQTMGDTSNRGKLIWMLMTARPELLPIDLKRQGRAEVHIPLFYPKDLETKKTFFKFLAKKVKFENIEKLTTNLKLSDLGEVRSGADIEAVLVKCKREEYLTGEKLTETKFLEIVKAFKSSISGEDLNHQIQSAIAEVTDMELLEE